MTGIYLNHSKADTLSSSSYKISDQAGNTRMQSYQNYFRNYHYCDANCKKTLARWITHQLNFASTVWWCLTINTSRPTIQTENLTHEHMTESYLSIQLGPQAICLVKFRTSFFVLPFSHFRKIFIHPAKIKYVVYFSARWFKDCHENLNQLKVGESWEWKRVDGS
jgi:hypothetical protein